MGRDFSFHDQWPTKGVAEEWRFKALFHCHEYVASIRVGLFFVGIHKAFLCEENGMERKGVAYVLFGSVNYWDEHHVSGLNFVSLVMTLSMLSIRLIGS
ncbi:hypothetical protein V6N11_040036 [Hibiscus sabdariffa]|uniref:Uncharacterized protein n=1 Tax=Hibiscus sabdariffa TaxID=183260 RepID=A0ABR2RG94_9ROSI